jgi:hypothetical protein
MRSRRRIKSPPPPRIPLFAPPAEPFPLPPRSRRDSQVRLPAMPICPRSTRAPSHVRSTSPISVGRTAWQGARSVAELCRPAGAGAPAELPVFARRLLPRRIALHNLWRVRLLGAGHRLISARHVRGEASPCRRPGRHGLEGRGKGECAYATMVHAIKLCMCKPRKCSRNRLHLFSCRPSHAARTPVPCPASSPQRVTKEYYSRPMSERPPLLKLYVPASALLAFSQSCHRCPFPPLSPCAISGAAEARLRERLGAIPSQPPHLPSFSNPVSRCPGSAPLPLATAPRGAQPSGKAHPSRKPPPQGAQLPPHRPGCPPSPRGLCSEAKRKGLS